MYGTLWAYSSVFAKSFATHLPIFDKGDSYLIYLMIFACVVVPYSMLEFSEQIVVQVTLSIMRIVMVLTMVITVSIALNRKDTEFSNIHQTNLDRSSKLIDIKFDNLYLLLPLAIYGNVFHHSIPSLAEPIRNPYSLNNMFLVTILICLLSYCLIGTIVSIYFGNYSLVSSNLNWEHYIGIIKNNNNNNEPSIIAKIISFFVVLFPAIDVASAFPLNAFTLGNNMMSAWYGDELDVIYEDSRLEKNIFRLLAALPPIVSAVFVSDLGVITDYTGLAGILATKIAIFFP
jgi:amino acid permease